jgi:hypothetical protein
MKDQMIDQCTAEIIQRITWLLDGEAGGYMAIITKYAGEKTARSST